MLVWFMHYAARGEEVNVLLACGNQVLERSIARAIDEGVRDARITTWHAGDPARAIAQVDPKGQAALAATEPGGRFDAAIVVDAALAGVKDEENETSESLLPHIRRLIRIRPLHALGVDGGEPAQVGGDVESLSIGTTPIYGIGTDAITLLLMMMRSLPVVPLAGSDRTIQPIWHGDLAAAIAAAVSAAPASLNRVARVAGGDRLTLQDAYERIATVIGRRPATLPVPEFLAAQGARMLETLGVSTLPGALSLPFDTTDGSLDPSRNDLSSLFGVSPIGFDVGLLRLIHDLDEITPQDGVGTVEVKRFLANIRGSRHDSASLMRRFREQFGRMMPIDVGIEPGAPDAVLREGESITMALPFRRHVQVRVEKATDDEVVLATLRGHALAGIVRFSSRPEGDGVRFEVMTCNAAANAIDWLVLTLGGAHAQDQHWKAVVQNVVGLSGGTSDGVRTDKSRLSEQEVRQVEHWLDGLIATRQPRP